MYPMKRYRTPPRQQTQPDQNNRRPTSFEVEHKHGSQSIVFFLRQRLKNIVIANEHDAIRAFSLHIP
jgi:hypothetical protein